MKAKISRQTLKRLLDVAKPIFSVNDIQQVTNSVMLYIKGNSLKISVFNNEILFESEFPIETIDLTEDYTVLLDARILINILSTNDVEYLMLSTESPATEVFEGNGMLEVRGDSLYSLPVRSALSYPQLPNLSKVVYKDFNAKEFIDTLSLCTKFTDKEAIGYERGICFTGKKALVTDHRRGLALKKDLDTELITLTPNIAKPLSEFENVQIGKSDNPKMLTFKGIIGVFESYLGVFPIMDEFPSEKVLSVIHDWVSKPSYSIEVSKEILSRVLRRFRGFILDNIGRIEISIDQNLMTLSYKYNQYESIDTIECVCSENSTNFGISMRDLEDLIGIVGDKLEFRVSKGKPVLYYNNGELFYFSGIYLDE